jgi:hypothetical protein
MTYHKCCCQHCLILRHHMLHSLLLFCCVILHRIENSRLTGYEVLQPSDAVSHPGRLESLITPLFKPQN